VGHAATPQEMRIAAYSPSLRGAAAVAADLSSNFPPDSASPWRSCGATVIRRARIKPDRAGDHPSQRFRQTYLHLKAG